MSEITVKSFMGKYVKQFRETEASIADSETFGEMSVKVSFHYIADGDDLAVDFVVRKAKDGEFET